jgi:hypothetical protein
MRMKIIRIMILPLLLTVPGLAWGGFNEGLSAAQRGDYSVALREWQPLAQQGDANAQYHIGVLYHNGFGVTQDYQQAINWYRKAAEQGLAAAQFNLGVLFHNGGKVKLDYVQAYMWFDIAGINGVVQADNNRDVTATKMTPPQIAEAKRLAREWVAKHPHPEASTSRSDR